MKICIVTGTRAEYGLLKPLIEGVRREADWKLQMVVTGAHLSPEFGSTYKQIEEDGVVIDKKIEMLLSADSPTSIIKSIGLGMIGLADALSELSPDLIMVLGDRYELLAVVSAALILKIPIAHLHGGEITEGAYDDAIRHAITKISNIHFTSTGAYKTRIIQMGENPAHVHNVGAIGLDNIKFLNLLNKEELEASLGLKFAKYNYLAAFHPATLDNTPPIDQFETLLQAILLDTDSYFIFTKSNADTYGREINQRIDKFVAQHPDKAIGFTSLGSLRFLSLLKICTGIIGNSSSGIIEAPSLGTPTINIGDRQKGRMQAASIINVPVDAEKILLAIQKTKEPTFQASAEIISNPYGNGSTTEKILSVLRNTDFSNLVTKKFFDLT